MFELTETLFDGDDELFKWLVKNGKVYGEYGCGASTLWVNGNTECVIYSVDTSVVWRDDIASQVDGVVCHIDVGAVGEWGYPLTNDKSLNYSEYANWIWRQDRSPDVVLVDGRFRVLCFLTTLLNSKSDTYIIFDDYRFRPFYHYVERYVKPIVMCGRQAIFMTPDKSMLDVTSLQKSIEAFKFVVE